MTSFRSWESPADGLRMVKRYDVQGWMRRCSPGCAKVFSEPQVDLVTSDALHLRRGGVCR
jgi:hypothetical protein